MACKQIKNGKNNIRNHLSLNFVSCDPSHPDEVRYPSRNHSVFSSAIAGDFFTISGSPLMTGKLSSHFPTSRRLLSTGRGRYRCEKEAADAMRFFIRGIPAG
jgi:hypothetical protein